MQVLRSHRQSVKCMARLVQNRFHVPLNANCVHEDEGQTRLGQRGLVTAGRLSFPVREIEQAKVLHLLKTLCQLAIQRIKDLLRARDHLLDSFKRAQRSAVQRIDCQVSRS